jgi:hypothetical protein
VTPPPASILAAPSVLAAPLPTPVFNEPPAPPPEIAPPASVPPPVSPPPGPPVWTPPPPAPNAWAARVAARAAATAPHPLDPMWRPPAETFTATTSALTPPAEPQEPPARYSWQTGEEPAAEPLPARPSALDWKSPYEARPPAEAERPTPPADASTWTPATPEPPAWSEPLRAEAERTPWSEPEYTEPSAGPQEPDNIAAWQQAAPEQDTTPEELPRFLVTSRGGSQAVDDSAGAPDRFAELVYAARNNAIEYEPEPLPPLPVRTSSKPLFITLLVLFIIAVILLEHRLIGDLVPPAKAFFKALGLK